MKENKYTCDMCKKTAFAEDYDYPKGWRNIIFDYSTNTVNRMQKKIDLCDVCAKKFNIEPTKTNDDKVKKTIAERFEDIIREIITEEFDRRF